MTPYEMLCLSKLFYITMGMMDRRNITHDEVEIACELLKKMADQRYDWNDQQKNYYKFLVDFAKELSKNG